MFILATRSIRARRLNNNIPGASGHSWARLALDQRADGDNYQTGSHFWLPVAARPADGCALGAGRRPFSALQRRQPAHLCARRPPMDGAFRCHLAPPCRTAGCSWPSAAGLPPARQPGGRPTLSGLCLLFLARMPAPEHPGRRPSRTTGSGGPDNCCRPIGASLRGLASVRPGQRQRSLAPTWQKCPVAAPRGVLSGRPEAACCLLKSALVA